MMDEGQREKTRRANKREIDTKTGRGKGRRVCVEEEEERRKE